MVGWVRFLLTLCKYSRAITTLGSVPLWKISRVVKPDSKGQVIRMKKFLTLVGTIAYALTACVLWATTLQDSDPSVKIWSVIAICVSLVTLIITTAAMHYNQLKHDR